MHLPRLLVLVCLGLVAQGCAGSAPKPVTARPLPAVPSVVTAETYEEALRAFMRRGFDDPQRAPSRDRILQLVIERANAAVGADDFAGATEGLAAVTNLYTPDELVQQTLPAELTTLAQYLIDEGSPRGDEARVLSGMLLLQLLQPQDAKRKAAYEKLVQWGFESRAALSGPLEPYEGLVEAWEEHARLTPAPEVLQTLSRLYVERRDALMQLFQSPEQQVPMNAAMFQGVQRTALDVAAVFLRHGDTASALTHVEAMGSAGGIEERLVQMLRLTREGGVEAAGAVLDLGRAYLEGGRPDVAQALCASGLRKRPDDARFAQCLARIAATRSDYGGAMAWYADAISLVPDERPLYDEIVEVLNNLIEQGLFTSESGDTRRLAARATEILQERMRRWPDDPPPVTPDQLHMAIGMAEMNAGNAAEAERQLRESLRAQESTAALLQLGLLIERTGRAREAADLYRRALEVNKGEEGDDPRQRAEILERLGDALRLSGSDSEATRMYEQGLAIWDQNLARLKGKRVGAAQLRRGVLLGRLAKRDAALAAFEQAMENAPGMRETYATILSFLVGSVPDPDFAHRVFRHAQNQVSLEPEWKVYFALWLGAIDALGTTPRAPEEEAREVLESMAGSDDWWAKLAAFGAGRTSYAQLLEQAEGLGEQTEAHFYEGVRLLRAGDLAAARAKFEQVLSTRMVNFYEYAMAQELVAHTTAAAPAGSTPAAVPPQAAPISPAPESPRAAPAPAR